MKRITVIFLLLSAMAVNAQKSFTLDDLIPGGKTHSRFVPQTKKMLQWRGDEYVYLQGKDTLYSVDPASNKEKIILTTDQLNIAFEKNGVRKTAQIPGLFFLSDNPDVAVIAHAGHIFGYDVNKQEIIVDYKEEKGRERADICHQTLRLAFTNGNNLYVASPDNTIKSVTREENKNIVCGRSVHREEFGIEKGTFWSPQGNYLAFYRMDQTMVGDYPLVDISKREAESNNIKYPMAGMNSHQVTVGIYGVKNDQTIYLKTGTPKDRYFTNIAWSPDEKILYIAEVNRGQDTCRLNAYNVSTGKKEATLFEETHPKYVEPRNPPIFLNKSDQFIWQSQRSGFNHLYLYQTDGKLLKPLTSGDWVVTRVIGTDEKEENLFYLSTEGNPIEIHPYKVNLKTGERTRLSDEPGIHEARISKSGTYALDIHSAQHQPNQIDVIRTADHQKTTILTASDPYRNYKMPEITVGSIKADDGTTDLYYRLMNPVDFDPSRKYPVIIYVYGGAQFRLVQNSWLAEARGWDIYMAQKGYVVFALDNRGSKDRGLNFENVIFRRLGIQEAKDQMKGVEFLKSQSYVDTTRIGVHGWSFGGFMTVNLMLRYPETFKVGVAGGPVIDWKYYEIMYGERYMDTPKENPDGYKETNLNRLAGNLKGRLLLIHGDMDSTVVWQHSLSFLKACVDANTYPDYFVYPGHEHNIFGTDRVHLYEKITRYFDDYLN
ncbi:MAG: S9 family peptidase [Candidatus Azobacteroides sp.]|nr:S9 family peptidase [Candidatus Azobacteroides sp.]